MYHYSASTCSSVGTSLEYGTTTDLAAAAMGSTVNRRSDWWWRQWRRRCRRADYVVDVIAVWFTLRRPDGVDFTVELWWRGSRQTLKLLYWKVSNHRGATVQLWRGAGAPVAPGAWDILAGHVHISAPLAVCSQQCCLAWSDTQTVTAMGSIWALIML